MYCSLLQYEAALLFWPDAPFSEFGELPPEPAYQTQKSCSAWVTLREHNPLRKTQSDLKYYHFKMQITSPPLSLSRSLPVVLESYPKM
jgi:hypothetical protein